MQQVHRAETLGIGKRWQQGECERNEFLDICEVLLKKREEESVKYDLLLHRAIKDNQTCYEVKQHVTSVGLNEIDTTKQTALHVAVIFAKDKICDLLLKNGADVHAMDITPL